jgi:hypothetical protein
MEVWRPRPESNRGARICSPLRNHSATRPRRFRRSTRLPYVARIFASSREPGFEKLSHGRFIRACSILSASRAPAFPANDRAASETPDRRKFVRQNQNTERNHPESKDGQKTQTSKESQRNAERDSEPARLRHPEFTSEHRNLSGGRSGFIHKRIRRIHVVHIRLDSVQKRPGTALCRPGNRDMMASLANCEPKDKSNSLEKLRKAALQSRKGFAIGSHVHTSRLFPGSSVVEQPAVNRLVAGSNPARGATFISQISCSRYRGLKRPAKRCPAGYRKVQAGASA